MKVCIGGTFDIIHKGHKKLIKKAFEEACKNGSLYIGLSKEKLTISKNNIKKWQVRKKNLEKYINEKKYKPHFVIKPISDIYGPTIDQDFDVIVVSPETYANAKRINNKRLELNKRPIEIVKIPYVLADDKKPISSTRIKNGEIDKNGNLIDGK